MRLMIPALELPRCYLQSYRIMSSFPVPRRSWDTVPLLVAVDVDPRHVHTRWESHPGVGGPGHTPPTRDQVLGRMVDRMGPPADIRMRP